MNTLRWREICPEGEHVHVASIQTGRQRTPDMHRHDFYECFLTLSGQGRQWTPSGIRELPPGELHFVRPEHAHCIHGTGVSGLHFLNVAFSRSLFHDRLPLARSTRDCWRAGAEIRRLACAPGAAARFQDMALEAARGPRDLLDAQWLLAGLLRLIREDLDWADRPGMPDWLRSGLAAAAHPEALRTGLPALIRACGRSQEHINRVFRQALGTTPTAWVCQHRLEWAAARLRTTPQPILEVVLDCGFESPSYFHRRFRETYGTTPLHYRHQGRRIQP